MSREVPDRRFINYPKPIEATKTTYKASFFWSNAGFGVLRQLGELIKYEPRYDPTVIRKGTQLPNDADLLCQSEILYSRADSGSPSTRIEHFNAAYQSGEITPVKVVEVVLDLIEKASHKATFVSVKRDDVFTAAKASAQRFKEGKARSLLDGVPVAVKDGTLSDKNADEVDLDGHSKALGSRMRFTSPEGGTSWCVRKWEEAGAIIIGKLNMHEYGLDTCGNNPLTGTPMNPQNPSYYPGGSSSASATTVSSNLLPLTLGVDGGGSIRIPSSFCGIYGLKPTHGRISRSPTISAAFSTSVAGPMAGSMKDLELGYRIMATPNPNDGVNVLFAPPLPPFPLPSFTTNPKVLGICRPWFDAADPAVLTICDDALSHYRTQGYDMIDISIPYLHEGQLAHAMTILTEASAAAPPSLSQFSAPNKILLSVARQTPAHDLLLAQKMRDLLMTHLAHLFKQHPGLLIVSPTTPIAGWTIGSEKEVKGLGEGGYGVSDANTSVRNMTYVWLANFTGCPAISVPVGMAEGVKGRVPVGLMAMGEWGDEEDLIEWGKVGEDWAWGKDGGMEKPAAERWVDVLALAGARREVESN
ncbi:uncharacterized protein KY384_001575 [Bacidia gigantensis]|uniref:uncharacterized protein n=1 Tax=Bacidia gigantensis TaxID=2732470 RepID=UPI001D050FFD|nr:uncharacterized protein KY384_001575 [Bacidia gigantensis]KAG8533834.1 hypothetical protein KY384_001575 [Bacidia gigantensis]